MATEPGVLLIAGAGSGMGLECAGLLASKGYRVFGSIFLDREEAAVKEMAASRGVSIETVRMDVTKRDQVDAVVKSVTEQAGRIDGLLYFAGISLRGFVEDLQADDIRKVFEVNFYGALNCIQAVLPGMRERRSGRMLITTSAGGRIGSMSIGGYVSSKFAMEGLVECLAQEVELFNVHCSLIEPGLIKTPHFTVHRNRAAGALNPASPYYRWFVAHEKMVDDLLERKAFTTADVAKEIYKILQKKRPKLRYLIGREAKLVVNLRRYIPGEIFQRLHWRFVRRIVTNPKKGVAELSPVENPHT